MIWIIKAKIPRDDDDDDNDGFPVVACCVDDGLCYVIRCNARVLKTSITFL